MILALFAVALCASAASADVPNPAFCEVQPSDALNGAVLCPDNPSPVPASKNTITVRNGDNNVIPDAVVTVTFTSLSVICPDAVLTATTNASGVCTITLAGGGCAHQVPSAAVFKANGVTIRDYENAKSPDYDGGGGTLLVNLPDLIQFSNEFLNTAPNECHDYDNTGETTLPDLIIFSPPFLGSNTCP
jgi:hypothetical protein